jgi:hypothetical protein
MLSNFACWVFMNFILLAPCTLQQLNKMYQLMHLSLLTLISWYVSFTFSSVLTGYWWSHDKLSDNYYSSPIMSWWAVAQSLLVSTHHDVLLDNYCWFPCHEVRLDDYYYWSPITSLCAAGQLHVPYLTIMCCWTISNTTMWYWAITTGPQ